MNLNKNLAYGIIAVALVAIVLAVVSTTARPAASPQNNIVTVSEGTQNAAAAISTTVGQVQNITWSPANFPSANVSVNVIRKTGDDPARYDMVRVIQASTPNTGTAVWTPSADELGSNIYIEIGCVNAKTACRSTISQSPLSVSK